jgi:general stress protein YciG
MQSKQEETKRKRGFALMSPDKLKEIAKKGGKSVPPEKRTFSQDPEHAAKCGQKGGKGGSPAKRTFAISPDIASKAGASMSPEKRREVSRKGAAALHAKRRKEQAA